MSGSPRVSVIMGVHNDERYVAEAVESVLEQTFTDFEFIIVEDAPTDGTPEILEGFDDARITRLRNETNLGLTRSLNRAVEAATGKYLARQDADDRSRPDRFERQVRHLEEIDTVACVGSSAHLIDPQGEVRGVRLTLRRPRLDDFRTRNQVIHGSAMMRRSVVEKLGGYNELFEIAQDYELWLRILDRWPIHNLEPTLYQLRLHDASVYVSNRRDSRLYGHLARRSVLKGDDRLEQLVRNEGIGELWECLSEQERRAVENSITETLLRYGQFLEARGTLREMKAERGLDLRGWVLYVMTFWPEWAVDESIKGYRTYQNLRVRLANWIRK